MDQNELVQKMKPGKLPGDVSLMIEHLCECLETWEQLYPKPKHSEFVPEWKATMKGHIDETYTEDDLDAELVDSITEGLLEAFTSWEAASFVDLINHDDIHKLMTRPQTAQRTNDWYSEFQLRLTASEISKVFGSPRERGTLVMMKAGKIEVPGRGGPSVCYKDTMTPFDWGTCLEPVVKMLVESEWEAMIHDCGRFVHLKDSRLAASPDGLILRSKRHPDMAGNLLEIKCPKSRKIGLKIPSDYYYQMQLQLEVTGMRACEYVEARLAFVEEVKKSVVKAFGKIAVVGCFNEEVSAWIPCKYVYGPIGDLEWKPILGLNEQTLELNTWVCEAYHHERVQRDEAWFASLRPKLEEFWLDVEKAKIGEFTLPESSRKKKDTVCMIVEEENDQGGGQTEINTESNQETPCLINESDV
jgi:hypothetical protein